MKPKTVNVLTVLNKLLKVVMEWRFIPALPCRIRLLKSAKPVVEFYEESEYEHLVTAAERVDPRAHPAVLLGGDAGLRLGEILGLESSDRDFNRIHEGTTRGVRGRRDGPATSEGRVTAHRPDDCEAEACSSLTGICGGTACDDEGVARGEVVAEVAAPLCQRT